VFRYNRRSNFGDDGRRQFWNYRWFVEHFKYNWRPNLTRKKRISEDSVDFVEGLLIKKLLQIVSLFKYKLHIGLLPELFNSAQLKHICSRIIHSERPPNRQQKVPHRAVYVIIHQPTLLIHILNDVKLLTRSHIFVKQVKFHKYKHNH
jgi:hypothetical protein